MKRRDFLGALAGLAVAGGAATPSGCGGGGTKQGETFLPGELATTRGWITFAPPRPFDPTRGIFPTEADLKTALTQLRQEGWSGLVTYSLEGTLGAVPRIAKQAGFRRVIAGLFWFDDAQLDRERAAARSELSSIDAFVLGNEGLQFGRYTRPRLESELARLKAETGRPVATTEPDGLYLSDNSLLQVGDWVFPTIHPWFAGIRSVPEAVQFVQNRRQALQAAAPGRIVVSKESWWPTGGGDPAATEANQAEFFRRLASTPVQFVFGEAYDQFWKTAEGPQGPHWGFHTDLRSPKSVLSLLQNLYTGDRRPHA